MACLTNSHNLRGVCANGLAHSLNPGVYLLPHPFPSAPSPNPFLNTQATQPSRGHQPYPLRHPPAPIPRGESLTRDPALLLRPPSSRLPRALPPVRRRVLVAANSSRGSRIWRSQLARAAVSRCNSAGGFGREVSLVRSRRLVMFRGRVSPFRASFGRMLWALG